MSATLPRYIPPGRRAHDAPSNTITSNGLHKTVKYLQLFFSFAKTHFRPILPSFIDLVGQCYVVVRISEIAHANGIWYPQWFMFAPHIISCLFNDGDRALLGFLREYNHQWLANTLRVLTAFWVSCHIFYAFGHHFNAYLTIPIVIALLPELLPGQAWYISYILALVNRWY